MPFTVKGAGPKGPVEEPMPDTKSAIEYALKWRGDGYSDVRLVDQYGRIFGPLDFGMLIKNKEKFDAPR